ncbi:hypothetical protein FRC09_008144 [Ceratobasidium sp. 395]|nr:hypothetical protein FRC09_008144 [Ceratobasidium sp. 395]
MPHQPVWPVNLFQLAERQALRLLCVDVRAPRTGDVELTTGSGINTLTAPVRLESQFEIGGASEDDFEQMARLLIRCWPNVLLVWRNKAHRWPTCLTPPTRLMYEALWQKVKDIRNYAH